MNRLKAFLEKPGKTIPIVLLCIGSLLFIYLVGSRDLWAPDEDEYAQISREMLRSGNWITPTCNDEPWTIKPVLLNWMIAVISLPYGDVNEWRARIFSALAALGTFMLTYFLGKRAFSPVTGALSALVLSTSVMFIEHARWAQTYMLSTFFSTLAITAFFVGYTTPARRTPAYLIMYAAVGLGVLTMGPVNLAMPALVCFVFIVCIGDIRHVLEIRLVRGALLFLAIAAPWYGYMALQEDYGFDLLIKTNLTRYVNTWTHGQPFYYYVTNLVWTFAPWSFFLPGALVLAFSQRSKENKAGLTFILAWFFSLLVFFSFADGKRNQYFLGVYPALALLVGYLFDRALQHWPETMYRRAIVIPSLILAVLWAVLAVAAPIGAVLYSREWLIPAIGLSVIATVFLLLTLLAWRRTQVEHLMLLPAAFMLLFVLYGVHVLIPRGEQYKSVRPYCEFIRAQLDADADAKWGMYMTYRAVYVYYADHFTDVLKDTDELKAFLTQPVRALVVMRTHDYEKLKAPEWGDTYVLDHREIGSRDLVLVSNRPRTP